MIDMFASWCTSFRHQDISLTMLLKLAKVFGSLIYTSLSTPTSVGVDIEAEKRYYYMFCYTYMFFLDVV